jgi:hypothetical protein
MRKTVSTRTSYLADGIAQEVRMGDAWTRLLRAVQRKREEALGLFL